MKEINSSYFIYNKKVQNWKTKLHFKLLLIDGNNAFYYRQTNKLVHGYIVLKKLRWGQTQNTAFDHIFDHLQTRTTWKQCSQEHTKAPFLDTKAPKITRNYTKNLCSCVRDTDFTRPNILLSKSSKKPWNKRVSGLFNFFQKNAKFPLWPHVLTTYEKT